MESLETRIAVLTKTVEELELQSGRTVSHVESEQRVRVEQGKRLDQCIKDLERIKDELKDLKDDNKEYRRVIYSENGLIIRLDRLEQRSSAGKENLRTGLSIGAVLLTLWKIISDFVKR